MKTNNLSSVQTSSIERIGLLLRTDLYTQRRNILYSLGALFLVIYIIPYLMLLVPDMTYAEWSEGMLRDGVAYRGLRISVCFFVGSLMGLVYLNRRVQHAHPIAFALLPAKVGEKAVSLILFTLLSYSAPIVVYLLGEFLLFLTVQGGYPLSIPLENFISLPIIYQKNEWIQGFLFLLTLPLTFALVAISFRRLRVGLFIGLGLWLLSIFFIGVLGVNNVAYLASLDQDTLSALLGVFLFAVNVGLCLAWWHKIKTIQL